MLYRTHHQTFIFTFNPFSHSSLTPHLPPSPSPSSPIQGMECVQLLQDLKSGAGVETPTRVAALVVDDFCSGVNGGTNCFAGDDFFVDELLDFSNGFAEAEAQSLPLEGTEETEQDDKITRSVLQEKLESSVISAQDDFGTLPCGEISVPGEGLESLEWLSHFVEDSFSDYSLTGKLPHNNAPYLSKPAVAAQERRCFATPVQTKARTKRGRTGVRVWPILSPSLTESSTSSSSSTYSTTSFPHRNNCEVQGQTVVLGNSLKKHKRRPGTALGNGGATVVAQPRRCSHCGVTKTPQWRAGPMGSKTLCNACGVRFKSGRLLPEYRPACSPTFSWELHSNNHRKVLEMRRKKESDMEGAGLSSPVQSF